MKRVVLLSALAFLIAVASLRAQAPAAPQSSPANLRAMIFSPAQPDQVPATDIGIRPVEWATGCSVSVRCTDGTVRTCSGSTPTSCSSKPQCWVDCNLHVYACTAACPANPPD